MAPTIPIAQVPRCCRLWPWRQYYSIIETCAQNHVFVGSQKRKRSDAHSIDELLSAVYNTDGGVGNAIVTAATVDLPSHVDTR